MSEDEEAPELPGLLEKLSPGAGLAAQQSLAALQQRLFGKAPSNVEIGGYVLEGKIAAGSGGAVYAARDPKRDRKVAIKLLHPDQQVTGSKGRARLLREAQSLAKLSHPNIVRVYDVGTYDPTEIWAGHGPRPAGAGQGVFVAMEFVEGTNLGKWLSKSSRPWREVRDAFVAAGRGLAAAHEAGIVHRDFKPANVLVGDDGRVVVADFGLARATRPVDSSSPEGLALAEQVAGLGAAPMDLSLTATGAFVGTPAYVAPEQHRGDGADARSDQYSFCVALHEGFFGATPFPSGSESDVRKAKEEGRFTDLPRHASVPQRMVPVLRRGMAPKPDDRYASMEPLLAQLAADPKRRTFVLALATAIVVAVAAAWAVSSYEPSTPCDDVLSAAAPHWSPAARSNLRKRIAAVDVPWSSFTAARFDARANAWVKAWKAEVQTACETPERLQCLQDRERALAALREALLEPTAARIQGAIDAAEALPSLAPCSSDALAQHKPPAGEIGSTLAAASVEPFVGTHQKSLAQINEYLGRPDVDADPELRATLLLAKGQLLAADGSAKAEATLAEALWAAAALGDAAGEALAGFELLRMTARDPARLDDARMFARHARAATDDPRLPRAFEARVLLERAYLHMTAGGTTAKEAMGASLAAKEAWQLLSAEPIQTPTVLIEVYEAMDRATHITDSGHFRRRAHDLAAETYGPDHPRTARLQVGGG